MDILCSIRKHEEGMKDTTQKNFANEIRENMNKIITQMDNLLNNNTLQQPDNTSIEENKNATIKEELKVVKQNLEAAQIVLQNVSGQPIDEIKQKITEIQKALDKEALKEVENKLIELLNTVTNTELTEAKAHIEKALEEFKVFYGKFLRNNNTKSGGNNTKANTLYKIYEKYNKIYLHKIIKAIEYRYFVKNDMHTEIHILLYEFLVNVTLFHFYNSEKIFYEFLFDQCVTSLLIGIYIWSCKTNKSKIDQNVLSTIILVHYPLLI